MFKRKLGLKCTIWKIGLGSKCTFSHNIDPCPKCIFQTESTLPNLVFRMESILPHFITQFSSIAFQKILDFSLCSTQQKKLLSCTPNFTWYLTNFKKHYKQTIFHLPQTRNNFWNCPGTPQKKRRRFFIRTKILRHFLFGQTKILRHFFCLDEDSLFFLRQDEESSSFFHSTFLVPLYRRVGVNSPKFGRG